jgi:hypothetical protein
MPLYDQFGFRRAVECRDIAAHRTMRQHRNEFWLRLRLDHQWRNNHFKRVTLLFLDLLFLIWAWENASFFYEHRAVLWGMLAASLAQVPVIYLLLRSRR